MVSNKAIPGTLVGSISDPLKDEIKAGVKGKNSSQAYKIANRLVYEHHAPFGVAAAFAADQDPGCAASVRMREGAATCRDLQCFSEPRSTGFWSATCPLSLSLIHI